MKAKTNIQEHKQTAQKQLAARLAMLESKGTDASTAQKDAVVKMFKADIRKANRRLAKAAAKEQLIARKVQDKADKAIAKKAAAENADAPKEKKAAAASAPKKEKKVKEKKPAGAKK